MFALERQNEAMADVVTVDTDDLAPSDVAAIRRVLDAAFAGRFDEHDWEHSLGGHHAMLRVGDAIVAHGAVVPRTMWIGENECELGYVEAVATAPAAQHQGFGSIVMCALAGVIDERYRIGLLSTCAWHFYERLGWRRWEGSTSVRRAHGEVVRTPDDDDGLMVLANHVGPIDLRQPITCQERTGDDW